MKKITTCLLVIILITACKKELTDQDKQGEIQQELKSKPSPPPPNANPAIAYSRIYRFSNQGSVRSIYVMNADGTAQTRVYSNYISQGNNSSTQEADFATWSPDGQKLSFLLNRCDLYTLNISLVNGVPTGSNALKIGDGVAGGGSYGKAAWRPGTNDIASVWQHPSYPTSIRVIPSSGGAPSTLYTSSEDFTISHPVTGLNEAHLTFNQDGSLLAFFERQVSTGSNFLRVLDLSSNTIVKNIDLSQFWAITGIDWTNTAESSIIGFSTEPYGCIPNPTVGAYNHKIYTIDINAGTPVPVMIKDDADDCTFSPDDTKTAFSGLSGSAGGNGCGFRIYSGGVRALTLSSSIITYLENNQGFNPDWKQ